MENKLQIKYKYNNKNYLWRQHENGDLLNNHPTTTNNRGINIKSKHQGITEILWRYNNSNSNRSLPGWCNWEEKYETTDQFQTYVMIDNQYLL